MSVFFFQAEDGIRDRNVTGVQTCALPIWFEIVPATIMYEIGSYSLPGRYSHWTFGKAYQIGRASCRERVKISEGAVAFKKKKENKGTTREERICKVKTRSTK